MVALLTGQLIRAGKHSGPEQGKRDFHRRGYSRERPAKRK